MIIVHCIFFILLCSFSQLCLSLECPAEADLDATVLIFGAGISGTTAARALYDNGITDIKIIEARQEIGGRIRKTKFANTTIELGAAWIYYITEGDYTFTDVKNPIWKLARTTEGCKNLSGFFSETYEIWDKDDNGVYSIVDATAAEDTFYEAYESALEFASNLKSDLSPNEPSLSFRQGLQMIEKPWNPQSRLDDVIEWSYIDYDHAVPAENISLFTSYPMDPDYYLITDENGHVSVVECIAQGIEDKLMLETTVNDISWNDDCVCASVTDKDGQDSTLCGKYGMVSFSFGVLSEWIKSPSKFNPPLSTNKQEALQKFPMGYYMRIFLEFPSQFWNKDVHFIYRADDTKGYFPVIEPVGAWIGNPNLMVMTVVDPLAKRIESQNINTTKAEIMVVLRNQYGNDIPDPVDIFFHDWIADPLYRGMFTHISVEGSDLDRDHLIEPDGNLYIIGDGAIKELYATSVGAYCSGLNGSMAIVREEGLDFATKIPDCSFADDLIPRFPTMRPPSSGTIAKAMIYVLLVCVLIGTVLIQ